MQEVPMKSRTMLLASFLAATALFAQPSAAADSAASAERAPLISQADLLAKLDRKEPDVVVIDVRTAAEFAAGHVPGARNVPHDALPTRLDELAGLRDKPVVLYCRSGRRTQIAEDILRDAGFTQLLHLEGDWLAWEAGKRPVEGQLPSSVKRVPR
jgi:rhodanese-related sulfurtransferase